jgi:hypothetical protein
MRFGGPGRTASSSVANVRRRYSRKDSRTLVSPLSVRGVAEGDEGALRRLADLVDMYVHRRVTVAGRGSPAKALVKILPAEIVDEESVGGLELAVLEEDAHTRPRLQAVDGNPGTG